MTNLDIVLATVKAEVAGPLDLEQLARVVLRLSVALVLGAAIGFLGAGAVLKYMGGRIHGLTSAGSIWATAAVGITAGLGHEATALLGTVFVLLVLAAVRRLTPSATARRAV